MASGRIAERSTYWVVTGSNSPQGTGDWRFYWVIDYEQTDNDRLLNRTKIIITTYVQANYTYPRYDNSGGAAAENLSVPSGTGKSFVNEGQVSSHSLMTWTVPYGSAGVLTRMGSDYTYVPHNSDGSCSFTWRGTGFGKGTATSTYTTWDGHFPAIPRGSTLSDVSNFNVDNGVDISADKKVSSYYDKLQVYIGSNLIKTINDFSSSTVTFTSSELNNIYSLVNTSSTTFTFKLSTYSDSSYGTQIGSTATKEATGSLTIIAPSFSGFDYSDTNDKTYTLTADRTKIIKGYSTLTVSIPVGKKAIANTRGATISHYLVNGNTLMEDSGAISYSTPNYSLDNVTVQAVDSRGSTSTPINISFKAIGKLVEYEPLFVKDDYDYVRSDNEIGEIVTINFDGTWWNNNFGATGNWINTSYEFKKSTATSYIQGSPISVSTNGNTFSYNGVIEGDTSNKGFDIATSYDVIVTITDALSSKTITYDLHAGEPAIAIFGNKCSLGAAYDEILGGTQLRGDVYIKDHCVVDAACDINGSFNVDGVSYINGACYVAGENIQNFKGTKISSGTSLPGSVENGSVFILY